MKYRIIISCCLMLLSVSISHAEIPNPETYIGAWWTDHRCQSDDYNHMLQRINITKNSAWKVYVEYKCESSCKDGIQAYITKGEDAGEKLFEFVIIGNDRMKITYANSNYDSHFIKDTYTRHSKEWKPPYEEFFGDDNCPK